MKYPIPTIEYLNSLKYSNTLMSKQLSGIRHTTLDIQIGVCHG